MTRSSRDRRGAILALLAVSMVALIGLLVLSIDGGSLQHQKRLAQTAADAGALSAAIELLRNRSDSLVASAKSETSRNGFTDLVGGDLVTVTYPASRGNFSGPHYVDVVVQRTVPTFFAGIFGRGSVTIRGRATAGLALDEYCFIVLDPTGGSALNVENTARLSGSQCGIAVNSTDAAAATVTPTCSISPTTIGVVGGASGP